MARGSLFQYLAEIDDNNFPDRPLMSGSGTLRFARPRVVGPRSAGVEKCSRFFQAAMNIDVSRISSTDGMRRRAQRLEIAAYPRLGRPNMARIPELYAVVSMWICATDR